MNFNDLLTSANNGNAAAQIEAGRSYELGDAPGGINYDLCYKYYRMAAEQGDSMGENNLGFCYEKGYGVEQNYAEALKWYEKSASQNNGNGASNAAHMYLAGLGVEPNMDKALHYTIIGAQLEVPVCLYNLGLWYLSGEYVERNMEKAQQLIAVAASKGHTMAQELLDDCNSDVSQLIVVSNNQNELKHPNSQEMSEVEMLENSSPEELFNLSVQYLNGSSDEDMYKAYEYCFQSYKRGFINSAFNLGLMHLDGKSPVLDLIFAYRLMLEARGNGEHKADETIDNIERELDTFSVNCVVNPIRTCSQLPIIKGVRDSLEKFLSTPMEGALGTLCGRLGSIGSYPMVELRWSQEFRSICGGEIENPSDGLCIVVTFVQMSNGLTRASLEEAFYYRRFQQIDIFDDFDYYMCRNVQSKDNLSNVWEFVADCGTDLDKATRIATSLLYHLYGYKETSIMYPKISLDINGMMEMNSNGDSDHVSVILNNFQQFGVADALLIVAGAIAPFFIADELGTAILFAILVPFLVLLYGGIVSSNFRKEKYPKRNYIRFLRNPNANW